jgi:transglutaminase-like putative cysteine protease
MSDEGRTWLALRVAVLVTGCAGLLALTRGALSVPATSVALVLAAAASYASHAASSAGERTALRIASLGVAAVSVVATVLVRIDGGGLTPIEAGASQLKVLLAGVFLAQCCSLVQRRDLLVGTGIGVAMAVLPAGAAPHPSLAGPVLLCWVGAVTALVLAHRLDVEPETPVAVTLHGSAGRTGGRAAPRLATSVGLAVAVGLIAFLLLPRSPGRLPRSSVQSSHGGESSDSGRRSAASYAGGAMNLNARGALGDDPVLEVPADSPQLWRGGVLNAYDGTTWRLTLAPPEAVRSGDAVQVAPDHDSDGLPLRELRTDRVYLLGGTGEFPIVAPGAPVAITASAMSGRISATPFGLSLPHRGGSYSVVSSSTERGGTVADPLGTDDVARAWTALPGDLPARVGALAASLAPAGGDRAETVAAIERYLETGYRYKIDSPVAPRGADAVDHFLFESRLGFCEHFAAAEVVLLRTLGVPARVATGFAGGGENDDRRTIRAKNAHAWAEVWHPGIGWVSSDPTAGVPLAPESGSALATLMKTLRKLLATQRGRAVLALGVVLVTVLVTGAAVLLRRRRRTRVRQVKRERQSPVLAAFDRLETALGVVGRPRRPAESIAELTRRLEPEPAEMAALLLLERICYADTTPSRAEADGAAQTIDRLAARLLAASQLAAR